MEVISITDHDDGGATLELELTTEEIHTLVEKAITTLLREAINEAR